MATALKLRADIKKYEAALKSKATPQSLKAKLENQLEKAKGDLADMRAKKPTEKKGKKGDLPKQFGAYKGSGVDIKKDSERPAKPVGKRKSKSGKTYYEYRLNRIDIKQPPKKYPKLEKGGMMSDGGEVYTIFEGVDHYTKKPLYQVISKSDDIDYVGEWHDKKEDAQKELSELKSKLANGGMMAEGGSIPEGYHQMPDGSIMADSAHMAKGGGFNQYGEPHGFDNSDEIPYEFHYKEGEKKPYKVWDKIDGVYIAEFDNRQSAIEFIERKEMGFAKGGYMANGGELHRMDEVKMAKGGAIEHGLKMGDKIWADQFWENTIVVDNPKTGRAVVNLETGDRKEQGKMAKGGYMANGGETKTFNPSEFRNLLDKSIETLYMGLNEVEQAMRYLEVHNMGKKAYSIGEKIGLPSLRDSIENLDQASTNI